MTRPSGWSAAWSAPSPGQPLAGALEQAQEKLMDDPKTSHPFYWAAFIILGDGAKPLVPPPPRSPRRTSGRRDASCPSK